MPYLTGSGVNTLLRYSLLISVPQEEWFLAAVKGAISDLCQPYNWEKHGSDSVEDCVNAAYRLWEVMEQGGLFSMIGTILPYATVNPPTNTLLCDGSVYNRVDYPELYAVLDPYLIIDADTFSVPVLGGYVIMGAGAEIPIYGAINVGSSGGTYEHNLTIDQIPSHSHDTIDHNHTELAPIYSTGLVGEVPSLVTIPDGVVTGTAHVTVQPTGGDLAHNNIQPFMAFNYCIVAR